MDSLPQSGEHDPILVENQFHQIVSEIKASFPVWDEFIFKTGKLQTSIKSLVVVLGSFLETFHKLADIATGTKGGYINEMGVGLAKLGFRQKGIEDKLKSLINALSESLLNPTQDKLDEWRKSVVTLDKEHKAEFKKAQQDVKKASAEALKLKKKVKKGSKTDVQKQLEGAMSDHQVKVQNMEHIRKSFLRSAVGFSRGQFCHLITCFRPLVDIQLSMMTDLSSIQETMDVLIMQSLSPPPSSAAVMVHSGPPPSPDTSKGSYQDLYPGKPPTQVINPDESRKSSLSSSSSTQNNVSSPQHIVSDKETISKKDVQQLYRQHHHHHSCTSYESIKQQSLSPQQQLLGHCHHHNHHHHCHYRSHHPEVSSPSSSSSSTSPPPPPPLPTSSSLPSSPTRIVSAKAPAVTFPSPPPECTCGLTVSAKSPSPYALPLYIGDNGCTTGSADDASNRSRKSDYTKLFSNEDDRTNNEVVTAKESPAGNDDPAASRAQTVLTLEGYVKMNQLASYYVSQHGDAQSTVKKDLSSLQTLKFFKEITAGRSSKTAEDVLDCLKKERERVDPYGPFLVKNGLGMPPNHHNNEIKGQSQPAPRRSNLRDRSLPPSNRKNMRVQFVHQVSSPSPSSPIESSRKVESPNDPQKQAKTMSVVKSPSMTRVVDSVSLLPPLPPPEMLKQQGCFDDANVDDLPLPPPPEELS